MYKCVGHRGEPGRKVARPIEAPTPSRVARGLMRRDKEYVEVVPGPTTLLSMKPSNKKNNSDTVSVSLSGCANVMVLLTVWLLLPRKTDRWAWKIFAAF